ncbi:HNH endonuclease [Ruegeria sp. HKCCA5014]|uniref:HNH endonuclease n=1 Tax=Ruegeria sp. HKCCA5014 TaxID=2682980 RepID=UPI001489C253|nr:HNH endonuclease [Ruegeria sp. HKCCA5014]
MTPDDFIVFDKYRDAPGNAFGSRQNPTSFVSEADKQRYTRIHDALKSIVTSSMEKSVYAPQLQLKPMNYSPKYGARGHRPVDVWMSVCGSDSDAFGKMPQIYVIASERGVEIGFAVAIDEADYHDPNVKARNREIVPRIYAKLPRRDSELAGAIALQIEQSGNWHFNRKARLSRGDRGFDEWDSLSSMLGQLQQNGRAEGGGSIVQNFPIEVVDERLISSAFEDALKLFCPLLMECQPNSIERVSVAAETTVDHEASLVAFDPSHLKDGRTQVLRNIAARRGQKSFRGKLLAAYDYKCAISRTDVVAVLEAAHIVPYRGEETNHITNGLLLRTDLHTLFDLSLINIDPDSYRVHVSAALLASPYKAYHGAKIILPKSQQQWPSKKALQFRVQEMSQSL